MDHEEQRQQNRHDSNRDHDNTKPEIVPHLNRVNNPKSIAVAGNERCRLLRRPRGVYFSQFTRVGSMIAHVIAADPKTITPQIY